VKRRARLPKRHKGLGMRKQDAFLAHSAYVGCLLRTLPELATRALSDDSVREGMFEVVTDIVFGTGSFNSGEERSRFGGLFANESRLQSDLGISWKRLQDESHAHVDDPKEMLTAAPPEAIGCMFKEKPDEGASLAAELLPRKFSKKIIEKVEDAKAEQLRADMLALPVDSRVRQTCYVTNSRWLAWAAFPPRETTSGRQNGGTSFACRTRCSTPSSESPCVRRTVTSAKRK
jgi:hypothetical protein